ncbi:MAG: signal peptidase I, partial [Rubrobacteraceae bacterium]
DRVLANKFIYRFTDPKRGDIVVFKSVTNPNLDLIKRVVGLPGDTIQVKNDVLFVNGKRQKESYISKDPGFQPPFGPATVPKGHYFMMGDNRGNSEDSRYFGPVPKKNIEGEAFLRFWPLNRIGRL